METMRQDNDILSHQFCGQQGGGTSTHVAPWCERKKGERVRQRWTETKTERERVEEGKNERQEERKRERESEAERERENLLLPLSQYHLRLLQFPECSYH